MSLRNEIASLHARTSTHRHLVDAARRTVARALDAGAVPYVALSGGKDSTVVLSLVRELLPSIPAVWSDDEWWLPETGEYIERLRRADVDVRQIRTNARHTEWFQVHGDYDGIPDYAIQQGFGLVFLGLRQEESNARRMHLRKLGPLFLAKSDGAWHCNPIHNWTWRDVWAYIVTNGLDYNKAYDRLEEIGVPPEQQRIGPLAVERVLALGQIAVLKRGWPDVYYRFVAVHPEAAIYT
jgi:3'-phosphoadenosine 5'-phosphosulfate sulfotransferase (PAPS reductase)/FAD synthetase